MPLTPSGRVSRHLKAWKTFSAIHFFLTRWPKGNPYKSVSRFNVSEKHYRTESATSNARVKAFFQLIRSSRDELTDGFCTPSATITLRSVSVHIFFTHSAERLNNEIMKINVLKRMSPTSPSSLHTNLRFINIIIYRYDEWLCPCHGFLFHNVLVMQL